MKPFILVVAKDTDHSKKIREYITSDDFFRGYYKDKVIEINSSQRGAEKDENIEQLLSLEKADNKIEIVIHVNMLKEGWDVTNLYTIVPLRASASETLTEQTIGRGLRLPYREIGGVAPSVYLGKLEKKGSVMASDLDGYVETHWIDHELLRNNEFQDFIIDRAKKLLCAIEQATGRTISGKDSDEVKKAFGDSLM